MMRCCSKEEIDKAVKKYGKTDRDNICHVCPAKLSKRELEDLYFALLQNNLELKKTVNQQSEKQRQLNTKLQRMTATQKTYSGKDGKECCVNTKVLVHEQKNVITELTKENENLQEQIKQLNMKVCSTKQFLRRGSGQLVSRATSRPTSTIGAHGGSAKNSSSSALNLRASDDATPKMISVSCQCLEMLLDSPTSNAAESPNDKDKSDESCDRNKCKTEMDELKLKIVNLQEELSKAHGEYSSRISRLEQEMCDLHAENLKARSEAVAKSITIETKEEQVDQITKKLRDTECQCDELSTKLTIEKGKVAELETQVKAANVTSEAVRNIEEKISHVNMIKSPQDTFFTENRHSVRLPSKEDPLKLTSPDAKSEAQTDNVNREEPTKIDGRASTTTQETLVGPSDVGDNNKTSKISLNNTAEGLNKDASVPLDVTTDKIDKNVPNPFYIVSTESEKPEKISSLGTREVSGDANSKKADDSGYTEPLKSDNADESATAKGLRMMNEQLMSKIANLQSQLDALRIGMFANSDEFTIKNKDAAQLNSPDTNISSPESKYKRDLDILTDSDEAKTFPTCIDPSKRVSLKFDSPSSVEHNKSLQKGIIRWQNGKQETCKTTCEAENLPCDENCKGKGRKSDSDSRYQIPGPIPSSSYKSKYSIPKKTQQKSDEPDIASNVSSDIRSLHFGRRRSSFDRKNIDQYADEKPKRHRCSTEDTRKTSTAGQKKNFLINKNDDGSPPLTESNTKNTSSTVQFGTAESLKPMTANEDANSLRTKDTPAPNRKIGASSMSLYTTEEETLPEINVPPDANVKQTDNAVPEKDQNNTTDIANYTSNKDNARVGQEQCACAEQSTNSNAESSSSENKDSLYRHADENVSHHSAGFALQNIEKNNLNFPGINTKSEKRPSIDSQGAVTFQSRAKRNSIDLDQDLTGKNKAENNSATMHKTYVNAECETSSSLFDMPTMGFLTDKSPFSKDHRPEDKAISSVPEDTFYAPTPPLATSSPRATQEIKPDTKREQIQFKAVDVNVAEPLLDDACDQNTQVCTCPHTAARKDISVFRSCSGTLRFRTTDASALKFRKCNCPKKIGTVNCGTQPTQDKPQQYHRHDSGGNLLKTYTVPCYPEAVRCNRATSPENTDQEISSMTDLPSERSEKDASKSPRCKRCFTYGPDPPVYGAKLSPTLSLGEDKATTTFTESTTAPFSYSLSEGELPQGVRRNTGTQQRVNMDEAKRNLREESASQKVEQALQAISLELAKCRQLLLMTRSQEMASPKKELQTTETEAVKPDEDTSIRWSDKAFVDSPEQYNDARPSSISLKRAEARPRIGDAYTPRVMFTLHIGTVVLSDEAVINSRELSLVLTWQFYEQNVAMCRLRPGRVVPFDFSTEYDLKLTDDFLEYLKSEELVIKICEENKLDVPFASCSLPLREALLHTNRRADLSLALVAGPRMQRSERTADALDGRDELGVLDVWCMLRADPKVVPNINKSIAHSTRLSSQLAGRTSIGTGAGGFTALTEDEQEDLRVSADLEPMVIDKMPLLNSQDLMDRGVQQLTSNQARQDRVRCDNYGYRDSVDIKHPPSSMNDLKRQVSFDDKWAAMEATRGKAVGIIANEVPANIKSNKEMKEALEKNYSENPRRTSNASSKDVSIMSRKQKKLSIQADKPNILLTQPSVENYLNNSNYANTTLAHMIKHADAESTNTQTQGAESAEIAKRYDYVSRVIGARKAAEAFKKVTIKPEEESVSLAPSQGEEYNKPTDYLRRNRSHSIDITILWLALNDECQAMGDPNVQRLYVAYTFLGRGGAELETPISLPKPKQYQDKCHFNFKKSFQLAESDLPTLGRMAKARSTSKGANARESIVFTVVSEPVEDPLGLNNCEDIGNAHLFLGDLLAYSAGNDSYTEVIPVRATVADDIIGVLAVRVDGLDEVRKCLMLSSTIDDNAMPNRSFW